MHYFYIILFYTYNKRIPLPLFEKVTRVVKRRNEEGRESKQKLAVHSLFNASALQVYKKGGEWNTILYKFLVFNFI